MQPRVCAEYRYFPTVQMYIFLFNSYSQLTIKLNAEAFTAQD